MAASACELSAARMEVENARKGEQAAILAVREATAALAAAAQAVSVAKAYQERLLAYQAMQEKLSAAQLILRELTEKLSHSETMVQQCCGQSLQAARDAVAAAMNDEKVAFAAMQKASAAYSAAATALRAAEARLGRGSSGSGVQKDVVCSCGNSYLADSAFCRKCGKHRDAHGVPKVTFEHVDWEAKLREAEMAVQIACGSALDDAKNAVADARQAEQYAASALQEAAAALAAAQMALRKAQELHQRAQALRLIEEKRAQLKAILMECESKFHHAQEAMNAACGQALEHAKSDLNEARIAEQKATAAEMARRAYLLKIKEYNVCLEFLDGMSSSKRARLA